MLGIGTPELIIIAIIALFVFGPRKLPELMRSLGKSLGEFKRASNDLKNTLDDEIRLEETRFSRPPASPTSPVLDPHAPGMDHTHGDSTPPHGDPVAPSAPGATVARDSRP
ncbi:MAG: twin-arginine translocase TatA/TatE family subunit [Acidobacteriota bacterium]|nr:twin-arginine translocase TatA/TatE family subunit [Acidobacteriota bacterium]